MRICLIPLLLALAGGLSERRSLADEKESPPVNVSWENDYFHATETANNQQKMLLAFFSKPDDPASQRLESESFSNQDVARKLREFVCLRVPTDAKISLDGKEVVLLQHASLSEMRGQPGVAIIDYAHDDPKLHGYVVSVFPLNKGISYGPAEMAVILDLPKGTLTQRTLIYAVRVHPERPASALGRPDERLLTEAENHSQYQANIRVQGHHGWGDRGPRIAALFGGSPREVCAESWPGQDLVESAVECVRCWRQSPGHWGAVRAPNRAFGYDMRRGSNGVWYATGIFAAD